MAGGGSEQTGEPQEKKTSRIERIEHLYSASAAYQELLSSEHIGSAASEAFFETAVRSWIGLSQHLTDASRALQNLANAMWENHRDAWLGDFLAAPFSLPAVQKLQAAIGANLRGDPEKAARDAQAAAALFKQSGNFPGEARSRFEQVFASHRRITPGRCLKQGYGLLSDLSGKSYTWIEIQLLIETGICEGMDGSRSRAWRLLERGEQKARSSQYGGLLLRVRGMEAGEYEADGDYDDARSGDQKGLDLFWQGAYPGLRAFQFYSDMAFTAKDQHQWYLAQALQLQALAMLREKETERKDFQGYALGNLAAAEERTKDFQSAQVHFQSALAALHELPDNGTTRAYIADLEITLAEMEARDGEVQLAVRRLEDAGPLIKNLPDFLPRLRYRMAQALLARWEGDTAKEKDCLKQVVRIGDRGFRTLNSPIGRWAWRQNVGPAYRRLVEIELLGPHDRFQSLADWETFRALSSPSQPVLNIHAKNRLQELIRGLRETTLLAFAGNSAEDGIHVWLADDRLVREFSLQISLPDLKIKLRRFYLLCADPKASTTEISPLGKELYGLLLAQLAPYLDPNRLLLIEPDELLSGLPWSALVTPENKYLGETYALGITPGLFHAHKRENAVPAQAGRPLVMAPGHVIFRGEPRAPLPRAIEEAQTISRLLPNSLFVAEAEARRDVLLKWLPQTPLFHFAGHAVGLSRGGELLLAGKEGENTLSAKDVYGLRLRRCRLVVLSACSTATAGTDLTLNPEGLVPAFLNSGAGSVVASRWDVDSQATGDLMESFYRYFSHNQDAARALKQARQAMISQNSHPYYWAAFEVFENMKIR